MTLAPGGRRRAGRGLAAGRDLWWEAPAGPSQEPTRCAGDLDAAARCWTLAHGVATDRSCRGKTRASPAVSPTPPPPPSIAAASGSPKGGIGSACTSAVALRAGLGREGSGPRRGCEAPSSTCAWRERHAETYRKNLRVEAAGARSTEAEGKPRCKYPRSRRGRSCRWDPRTSPRSSTTRAGSSSACYLMAYVAPDARRTGADGAPTASD